MTFDYDDWYSRTYETPTAWDEDSIVGAVSLGMVPWISHLHVIKGSAPVPVGAPQASGPTLRDRHNAESGRKV